MFCTMCLFLCSNSIFIATTMKKSNERVLMREGANYEVYTFNIGIKNIMKYFIFIFFFQQKLQIRKNVEQDMVLTDNMSGVNHAGMFCLNFLVIPCWSV